MKKLLTALLFFGASGVGWSQCASQAFNPFTGRLDCVGVNTITPGTGDVVGPASSTTNHIPQYADSTGKLLKDASLALVTSVGTPGADTNVASEKAIRTAITTAISTLAPLADPTFTGTVNAAAMTLSGTLTTNLTGGGAASCLHVDNSGVVSMTSGVDCGSGGGGSGTVTHTAGNLTLSQIIVGNGVADLKVASAAATIDSSGNMAATSVTTGGGGSAAGATEYGAGTPPTITANAVQIFAPTAVTGYQIKLPAASGTGLLKGTDASNVNTLSFITFTGSSADCLLGTGAFGACPGGGPNVTMTGTQTATALVTVSSTNVLQSPSATSTLDSSGNAAFAGTMTAANGVKVGAAPPTCAAGTAGALCLKEGTAPTTEAGTDILFPDSTAHRWKVMNNGAAAVQLVISGVDINTSDQVTATHLAAALPVNQGGTGQTSYTDGQLLIGNTATGGLSKATLTAGANVTITNGNGTITIASTGGAGSGCIPAGTISQILVDGGDGTCLSRSATVDSSGNLAANSLVSTTYAQIKQQASPPSLGTTAIQFVAPAAVTSYQFIFPGTSATGFLRGTNSANVNTLSFAAASGTGSCTNQVVTALNDANSPTCTTITSSYVNNTIALTGTDINTSNQVTATHLASALPVAQGGTGLGTLTAHAVYVGNGTSAPTALSVGATNTVLRGATGADPSFGAMPLAALATQVADSVVMNASGSTAAPTAVAMPTGGTNGCAGATDALGYNTTTHSLVCTTLSTGGTVTTTGTPAAHQVAIFSGATAITGVAVGATDKPLVGATGADPVFSKLTLTNPATAATLTIANNKTFTVNNTLTFTGTDSSSVAFGGGGTVVYTGADINTSNQVTATHIASATNNTVMKANSTGNMVNSAITEDGTTVATTLAVSVGSLSVGTSPPSVTAGTGGVWASAEGTVPSVCAAVGVGCVYNDSTQHGLLMSRNNGSYLPIPQAPASTTSGNLASFNATNGGLLADSGVVAANVNTNASNFTSGNLVSANGNHTTADSGVVAANVVTNASNFTSGNLISANGNHTTADASIVAANVITDASNLTNHGVALGSGNKTIGSTAAGATDKPLVGVTGADPAFSKLTLTNPATAATLTIADNKSLTVSNILTLAGTDSTTMTFPSTSATISRLDAAQSHSAGAKNTHQASATTAGLNVAAATLPSTPATGDIAVDSGASNALKWYNGTSWQSAGGSASGCTTTGSAGQLLTDNGSGGCTSLADFVFTTHTLAGGASSILDMSAASVTAGLKIPSAAGAAPTADGFIATNTTNHTHVFGSNGTAMVGAVAATGTGTATTCSNQVVTAVSGVAAPTCTTITSAYVNNSIALTGTDINTSNQVTATHITSATDTDIPRFSSGNLINSSFQDGTNKMQSPSTTQALAYIGGSDTSANSALGGVTIRGANQTGAGGASSQGGYTLLAGGSNAATNTASVGGTVELLGGPSTGSSSTGLQGLLVIAESYAQSGTVTQWNLVCFTSTAKAVTDCGASPTNIAGVALSKSSTIQVSVAGTPSEIPINASAAVTIGHTVCAGTTAGQVTDSGGTTACATGITIGTVIATSGTWPSFPDGTAFPSLTTTLPLVRLANRYGVGNGDLAAVTALPSGVAATSMSLTTPSLGAATATSVLATGIIDGEAPVTVTTGTTGTPGSTYNTGYVFNQEATAGTGVTYTLPTAAAGKAYCMGNSYNGTAANTGVITIATSASGQFIIFTDGTLSTSGGTVTSGGAAGDFACVIGVDSTHWYLRPGQGTWTKN